ncbi:Thymidylate synthase ThyX [uncultured archaeon]|nr:Thymidylate synthase ThyX [uncultured archaeon]
MHITTKEADEILDKEFPVLDHGFVRLVDYMGGDSAIVQAARVSYGEGTKKISEDKALIRYLMRHEHTSPFEMVETKFHCKMPIFVARQWVRHRTASLNEISGRYSVMKDEFYIPEAEQVNLQSKDNKQGRSDETFSPEDTERILFDLEEEQKQDYANYSGRIEKGMAKELARINLPLSLYTEWYWKIDLHNLFHFLGLRLDKHAQCEIRAYANVIFDITKRIAPMACEAFENYKLDATKFSAQELQMLKKRLGGTNLEDKSLYDPFISKKGEEEVLTGEGIEFKDKLSRIILREE